VKYVKLENDMIEVVQKFCYLCDVAGSSGDVQSLKMFHDGIPNGLLKDRTGVEEIENHLGET